VHAGVPGSALGRLERAAWLKESSLSVSFSLAVPGSGDVQCFEWPPCPAAAILRALPWPLMFVREGVLVLWQLENKVRR
jgi:hypothetical protein